MKRGTVREDGMVYLRKRRGKEIWGTQEEWNHIEKWRKDYMEKRRSQYRSLPENKKYKIGQYNPENGLYFIRKSGNLSPIWGTKEQLDKYKEKRRQMKVVYVERMKFVKKERMANLQIRRRRGDIDPVLGLVFFKYNADNGNEIWYTKEKFNLMRDKDISNRSRIRTKQIV
jgi:hypothetical protein